MAGAIIAQPDGSWDLDDMRKAGRMSEEPPPDQSSSPFPEVSGFTPINKPSLLHCGNGNLTTTGTQDFQSHPNLTASAYQGTKRPKKKAIVPKAAKSIRNATGSKTTRKAKNESALRNKDISKDLQRTKPTQLGHKGSSVNASALSGKKISGLDPIPERPEDGVGLIRSTSNEVHLDNDGLGSDYQAVYANDDGGAEDLAMAHAQGRPSQTLQENPIHHIPLLFSQTTNGFENAPFPANLDFSQNRNISSNESHWLQDHGGMVDDFQPPPSAQAPKQLSPPDVLHAPPSTANSENFGNIPDNFFHEAVENSLLFVDLTIEDEEVEEIMQSMVPEIEPDNMETDWQPTNSKGSLFPPNEHISSTSPCDQLPTFAIIPPTQTSSPSKAYVKSCYPKALQLDSTGYPIPFTRTPISTPVMDRSPIPGLTNATRILTCFRISEAINMTSLSSRSHINTVTELYARILSSHREGHKQYFCFADLFTDKPPYLEGTFCVWKGVELWDMDCRSFLEEQGRGKMARVVGRMERGEGGRGWIVKILSVWEVGWGDVDLVKGEMDA